ncbi:murein hydrolase transporter LrgA [Aliidongia dinghuensis]|uniref:Murein hydrolase transporter LrgA n=1 Tax=Aliidongia dinghuensis TaxID=1867774 RepID=A0A8J2YXG7_9PROT|nr:CidA/LrgA family protein [Aliidongia dinghuensis]GGF28680.1 murein hydrolase transporter LrgA [Aliidongia dinghuensis]
MIGALFTLLGCQFLGELLRDALHLPIPGPVVGMILLAVGLALRGDGRAEAEASSALDRTAGVLLEHMGLLFVPAGVGVITSAGLLRTEWLPILGGLLGSTVLSLGVTGIAMHRLGRRSAQPCATPARHGRQEARS